MSQQDYFPPLYSLLAHRAGAHHVERFMKHEHSEENLAFWTEVEKFRREADMKKLAETARDLFRRYFESSSGDSLSLEAEVVQRVAEEVRGGRFGRFMFNEAQDGVWQALREDSYMRFCTSEEFERLTADLAIALAKTLAERGSNKPAGLTFEMALANPLALLTFRRWLGHSQPARSQAVDLLDCVVAVWACCRRPLAARERHQESLHIFRKYLQQTIAWSRESGEVKDMEQRIASLPRSVPGEELTPPRPHSEAEEAARKVFEPAISRIRRRLVDEFFPLFVASPECERLVSDSLRALALHRAKDPKVSLSANSLYRMNSDLGPSMSLEHSDNKEESISGRRPVSVVSNDGAGAPRFPRIRSNVSPGGGGGGGGGGGATPRAPVDPRSESESKRVEVVPVLIVDPPSRPQQPPQQPQQPQPAPPPATVEPPRLGLVEQRPWTVVSVVEAKSGRAPPPRPQQPPQPQQQPPLPQPQQQAGPAPHDLPLVTLDQMLEDWELLEGYQVFSKAEHSEENILFFVEAKEYAKLTDDKKREKAMTIFKLYVRDGAQFKVSISRETFQIIRDRILQQRWQGLFNEAMAEVRELIAEDSFKRFLASPIYREIIGRQLLATRKSKRCCAVQ